MTDATIMDKVKEKEKEDIRILEKDIENIKKKQLDILENKIN